MREKIGNLLAVTATAVLFVCMLVLCGRYIELRLGGVRRTLPEMPARDKWLLTDRSYDAHSGANTLLSPVMIGEKTNGYAYASTFEADSYNTFTAKLGGYLASLFQNGDAERVVLASEDEKRAYVRLLVSSENYLYAAFYNELPSDVMLPCITGTAQSPVFDDHFYMRYLFVLPDEVENAYLVALDNALNAVLVRAEGVPYHAGDLTAYTNGRGCGAFSFLRDGSPAAVFTESFTVDSVVVAPGFSFFRFTLDDDNTLSLLSSLDFNTNLVKSFRSRDDKSVNFVEQDKELYVDIAAGTMTYHAAAGKGIPLADVLRYRPLSGTNYTFADKTLAVRSLLNDINRLVVGGEAFPSLINVTARGKLTEFRLKYLYRGILLDAESVDVTVCVSDSAIEEITVRALFCDSGFLERPVMSGLSAAALAPDADDYVAVLSPDASTGLVSVVWAARTKEDTP